MKTASPETHHVFTDDEVETERKKIRYIVGRYPFEVQALAPMITFLLTWVGFGLIDGSRLGYATGLAGLCAAFSWLIGYMFTSSPSDDPLEPLSGDDFKKLRMLAEDDSSVAEWVREALEDSRTLRKRDLRAAESVNYLRKESEKEKQAKQSEECALQELRASVQRKMPAETVQCLGALGSVVLGQPVMNIAINIAANFATDADHVLSVCQLASGVKLSAQQVEAAKAAGLELAASGEPSVRSLVERWAQVEGLAEFAAAVKAAMMPN